MWVLAILGGMLFFDQVCKREGLPQKVSESIFVYGTLATILGARLGHCFFYEPGYFLAHPWAIITVSATAAWPVTALPSAADRSLAFFAQE